ncbi:MAG: CRISPR-associated protein Cas4 [Methanomassiliicoccales archaeon]|nr:MAG: CRISPR-associated protein Cas4 [Methanomassiliicoccales archaeon]
MTSSVSEGTISASDVEKYAYCPLSWWLAEQNADEDRKELIKGSKEHVLIGKDVKNIKVKERIREESERSVIWFSLIAVVIGINGVAIIFSIYTPPPQGEVIMVLLSVIAVLWVVVAVLFFYTGIMIERKMKYIHEKSGSYESIWTKLIFKRSQEDVDWRKRFREAKWTTLLFFLVSGVLAMHGLLILLNLEPDQPQLRSSIFLVLSLVWLIGSSLFYYISLHKEPKIQQTDEKAASKEGKWTFSESEISVILFAVVATIFASNSLTIYQNPSTNIGRILLIVAVLWLYGGFIFLYRALRANMRVKHKIDEELKLTASVNPEMTTEASLAAEIETRAMNYERGVIWFAAIAMVLALNAIIMNFSKDLEELYGTLIAHIFEIVALLWLIGATFFLYMVLISSKTALMLRKQHGIEKGAIQYVDSLDDTTEMFYSEKFGLRGRPDYILEKEGNLVPVEVKTGRVPRGPLFSHILQLAAYCLLIEDKYGRKPSYGIISYSNVQHEIDYTEELKGTLISKLNDMEKIIKTQKAHRNHNRPSKCRGCSRRKMCPEKLV